MTFLVNISNYEGPMDVLIDLIRKHKMDIYDIQIHVLCDNFLEHIQNMERINMEVTSDFVNMAALLLKIKSSTLLPEPESEDDEVEEDPREELVERILAYEQIKQKAAILEQYADYEKMALYKKQEDFSDFEPEELLKNNSTHDLFRSFKNIMEQYERHQEAKDDLEEIPTREFTFQEARKILYEKIITHSKFLFSSLIHSDTTKEELITYFLTILELMKNQIIFAHQIDSLNDIEIKVRRGSHE